MEQLIYEKQYTILMRDCDMFRRLKPSAILAMFQDCSEALTEGWGVGLDAMLEIGVIWVAARAECSVTRLPLHGETVLIRGWAARNRLGLFPFRYEIRDEADCELIRGCSMWVLSDLTTHSMFSGNIPRIQLPTPEPKDAPLPRLALIRPPASPQRTERAVRFSEVDINGHLTNTRYFDWICDLVSPDFHRDHPITGLAVDYRAETFPEETIPLDWELTENDLRCESPGRFRASLTF